MKKSELKELYKMMFPDYPDIVTARQLMEMLGISRKMTYSLIANGEIRAVKIGKSYKIPKVSVINYIMNGEEEENLGEKTDSAHICAAG